jgi:hypothetical protein
MEHHVEVHLVSPVNVITAGRSGRCESDLATSELETALR